MLRPDHHTPVRPRSSPEVIKTLVARLTDRDRHIMRLIWRHKVLTTDQLTALGWNAYNTAKQRLATLHRLRALDRIRPWNPRGGAPWHYVLDTPGAEILAAEHGQTLREFGYRRDRALAPATSAALGHLRGLNQVFTDLYAHTRTAAHDAHLDWWTEAECADLYGDIVRPDGAGTWTTDGRSVGFFLEYDTGTERLRRLVDKVEAYGELAQATATALVVLFHLPSRRREAHLRRALGSRPAVAVATATHEAHPAEAVWVRADDPHLHPRRLIDLAPDHTAEQPMLFDHTAEEEDVG
ncbi:replication-relaxation family protein [Streptomonospora salina]|uniref:replication-relaxation family protein n=1 Tax=Streptomonospora salina TaxID=104205 RepID=UPI0028A65022|nr:replication-relaxation family protein [Streptomonospora salina]